MGEKLIIAVIPLFLLMGLGFMLGRWQKIDTKPIALTLIYGITPIVALFGTAQIVFEPQVLLLPLVGFAIAALAGQITYLAGKALMPHDRAHFLLAHAAGAGNTGYMGLPIVALLYPPETVGLYLLAMLGYTVYDGTIGYYYIARGQMTAREAAVSVLKMPVVYALLGGLIWSALGAPVPAPLLKLWELTKGAYGVLGMMVIGLALAGYGMKIDAKFTAIGGIGKFVLNPLLAVAFIMLDAYALHLFEPIIYQLLFILSIVPAAANQAAYAAKEGIAPDRAAAFVLLTTLLAMAAYPWVLPGLLAQLPQ